MGSRPALTLAVLLTAVFVGTPAGAAPAPSCPPSPPGKGRPVVVGLYVTQIGSIDVKGNSFLADFYLWFRWSGDVDPTKSFELTNAIEPWDFEREAIYKDDAGTPKPEVLPDGCKFQQLHMQGRFSHPFRLAAYPLDKQDIAIQVEDARYTTEELFYVADRADERVDPAIVIPGFQIHGAEGTILDHRYPSAMGDPRIQGGAQGASQYRFTMHLERPLVGYLSKTLVPIVFILLITLLIFFVSSSYFEGRLGLAVTTLISAVALQLTTSADLPQVGYLVLVDKLYNLSYVMILFAMVESTVAVRWHDAGREEAARRLDRSAAILSVVGCIITTAVVLLG